MLSSSGLKRMIHSELKESGFKVERDTIDPPDLGDKMALRRVHGPAVKRLLLENKKWILEHEKKYQGFFADGDDGKPEEVLPTLVLIESEDTEHSGLFRDSFYSWRVTLS